MSDITTIMARDARLSKALKRFMLALDNEMDDGPVKNAAFGSAREAIVLAMRHQVRTPRESPSAIAPEEKVGQALDRQDGEYA